MVPTTVLGPGATTAWPTPTRPTRRRPQLTTPRPQTRRPRGTATIAEVADAAGVSRATVSRVMNGHDTVDADLVARVREVADRLHYRPSNVARSLSLGRTETVAVVVPDLANPMFQQVLRGVATAAGDAGYRVLVADTAEHAGEEERVVLDARMRCDALVLVSPRMPERALRALLPEVRPAVVVNRAPDGTTPTLEIDYAHGIGQIVEHLLALGHRHLLYLAGPTESASHRRRLEALRAAAAHRADVRLSEMPAGATVEAGYVVAEDVLAARPTAVVAYNDLVAFGLLARLNEIGVAVPGDLSIVGFDDVELARFATPSLTTAAVPQAELGRLAWQHLRPLLTGEDPVPDPVPIRPRLAVRASTGPVPPSVRLARTAVPGGAQPADPAPLRDVAWRLAAVGADAPDGAEPHPGAAVPTAELLATSQAAGIGELPLARYVTGAAVPPVHSPRPYLHPVHTPGGTSLTDVSPVDHRHHYGMSFAVPVVNGTSYWGGRTFLRDEGPTLLPNHGRQVPTARRAAGATLHEDLTWLDETGRPLLREERTLDAAPWPDALAWALRWRSVLHAEHGALRIESPATNGRPQAGYGGLFWRLSAADTTSVLGDGLVGEAAVHGSRSPWLAFVQRRELATTTLLLVQPPAQVRPWFVRVSEYPGAGPSLAWDQVCDVPDGGTLDAGLAAVLVDRALSADEAADLAARAWA
ncbi:PmoA family protein [Cellulomonas sp. zg-ZUI22]|nr:PmoA family protein [Cellulomonas sp. zg-ZUI22]